MGLQRDFIFYMSYWPLYCGSTLSSPGVEQRYFHKPVFRVHLLFYSTKNKQKKSLQWKLSC